jgi:hypothetical protein
MVQIESLLGAMQARGTVSAGEPRIKAMADRICRENAKGGAIAPFAVRRR